MTDNRISREKLTSDAIQVLTRAAHHSTDWSDALDFAGFLAHILSARPANVGGGERLPLARPGSWEASHLHALLNGTVGEEPDSWHTYRTEPLLVPFNVAELIESAVLHPRLLGIDEAIDAIGLRYASGDDGEALDAWDAEIDAVIRRYESEYRTDADRFDTAVGILGKRMRPPLDIQVSADANPTVCWWSDTTVTNPTEHDADPLTVVAWRATHHAVPSPSVDVRLNPSTEHPTVSEE